MKIIHAANLDSKTLNQQLRQSGGTCTVTGCQGQRFLAAGMSGKQITLLGITGNALGAYLNDSLLTVKGNAQDAVGDTMNAGKIVIHGSVGDAAGYAMRGGKLYVRGNAGYRTGIHMKAYQDKVPVIIIGGRAGSFLGEDQAGGIIIVLGLETDGKALTGNFPCTGMHGGKLFLRGSCQGIRFPDQVTAAPASQEDLMQISAFLTEYCQIFGLDEKEIFHSPFTLVTPNTQNPYKQMYVAN